MWILWENSARWLIALFYWTEKLSPNYYTEIKFDVITDIVLLKVKTIAVLSGIRVKMAEEGDEEKHQQADDSITASLIRNEHDSGWGTLMKETDRCFSEGMMIWSKLH